MTKIDKNIINKNISWNNIYEMREEIIQFIKIKGWGYLELSITLIINEDIQFDSIEWSPIEKTIILHQFIEDIDYEINWEDLPIEWQTLIYQQLIPPFLN